MDKFCFRCAKYRPENGGEYFLAGNKTKRWHCHQCLEIYKRIKNGKRTEQR